MTSVALKDFFNLLSSNDGKDIPLFVWSRVVVAAYAGDLTLGDELYK